MLVWVVVASVVALGCRGTAGCCGAGGAQTAVKENMPKSRNLVVGIRSFSGSRTALICAAEELLVSSPNLERAGGAANMEAHLDSREGPQEFLAGGFAFRSALPPEQVVGLLRAVEERLADPRHPDRRQTVRLELLWMAGVKMKTPTVTLPSPRLSSQRWAISMLVGAGENRLVESMDAGEEDRSTGRAFSHYFKTVPGEARWDSGVRDLTKPKSAPSDRGIALHTAAVDFLDVLSASADLMQVAEMEWDRRFIKKEKAGDLDIAVEIAFDAVRAVVPDDIAPVETSVAEGASDEARVLAWLAAVRKKMEGSSRPFSRAVIFENEPTRIRGALLLGAPNPMAFVPRLEPRSISLKPRQSPVFKMIEVVLDARNVAPGGR